MYLINNSVNVFPLLSSVRSFANGEHICRLLSHINIALCRSIYIIISFSHQLIHVQEVRFRAHIRSSGGGWEHGWCNATNTLMHRPSCQQIPVTQGQFDTLWITVKQAPKLAYKGLQPMAAFPYSSSLAHCTVKPNLIFKCAVSLLIIHKPTNQNLFSINSLQTGSKANSIFN